LPLCACASERYYLSIVYKKILVQALSIVKMLVFVQKMSDNAVMAGAQQGVTFALKMKSQKQICAPGGRATAKTRPVY
jgi:hypothetical protein